MSTATRSSYINPRIERAARAEIEELQLRRVQRVVARAYETNPFYRALYDRAKVRPEQIRTLVDFRKRVPHIDKRMLLDDQNENPPFGLRNTPKVVGGHTLACRDRAVAFYGKIVETVVPVKGTAEAEMAKLLENTYRHVNIALVNEMAMFCNELGIDLWSAIDAAATKPFGFQAFRPGPGVGGHCIPIDPNYLSHAVRKLGYPFHFVELAQEVNERMPVYVAQRATRLLNTQRKAVNGSNILLLGVTYKPDIADERETPALPLVRRLRALGAEVSYCDPHVPSWTVDGTPVPKVDDLGDGVRLADLSILLAPHRAFDLDVITGGQLVLDTRGVLTASPTVERL